MHGWWIMSRARVAGVGLGVAVAAVLVALGLSTVVGQMPDEDSEARDDSVIIQLRVWQRVTNSSELWVSSREDDGRWRGFVTKRLDFHGQSRIDSGAHADAGEHIRYGDFAAAGVGLRVWQSLTAPQRVFAEACGACPRVLDWLTLGKIPLPLTDGVSSTGAYRYGDLRLLLPRENPGLQADRDVLLALSGELRASPPLNWSVGTSAADWEGVTVSGTPSRVTGLDLTARGLAGEISGWVGNLDALTELRLNGNRLAGQIPSSLANLVGLDLLHLAGNRFEECIPPELLSVPDHDLSLIALGACAIPPPILKVSPGLTPGTVELGRVSPPRLATDWQYRMERSFDGWSPWLTLPATFGKSGNHTMTGLGEDIILYFQLRATVGSYSSNPSNIEKVRTFVFGSDGIPKPGIWQRLTEGNKYRLGDFTVTVPKGMNLIHGRTVVGGIGDSFDNDPDFLGVDLIDEASGSSTLLNVRSGEYSETEILPIDEGSGVTPRTIAETEALFEQLEAGTVYEPEPTS